MYVFLHNRYQLYDLKIKWSSARGKNSLRSSVTSFILMLVQIIQQSGVKTRNVIKMPSLLRKQLRHVHIKALHCFIETF